MKTKNSNSHEWDVHIFVVRCLLVLGGSMFIAGLILYTLLFLQYGG